MARAVPTAQSGPRDAGPGLWSRLAGRHHRHLWQFVFVAPFFLGLAGFVYVPILWSAWLSLFEARNTVTPTRFVGLENYARLLGDHAFMSSMGTFTVFAVFIVPGTFVCSLGLALLLNGMPRAQAFFRSAYFLPAACSYVVAAMVWRFTFFSGARFGMINSLLSQAGGQPVNWLGGDNPWYWVALVSLRLWLQVGFYMILFIAGLNRIPSSTYEAAALDGATGWRLTRHITIPQLRATSAAVTMLLVINAFQAFDEFYNLLGSIGSYPTYARPPLVYLYLISLGGSQMDLGVGSAGTMIVTAVIVVFGLVQNWVNRRIGAEERS